MRDEWYIVQKVLEIWKNHIHTCSMHKKSYHHLALDLYRGRWKKINKPKRNSEENYKEISLQSRRSWADSHRRWCFWSVILRTGRRLDVRMLRPSIMLRHAEGGCLPMARIFTSLKSVLRWTIVFRPCWSQRQLTSVGNMSAGPGSSKKIVKRKKKEPRTEWSACCFYFTFLFL